MEDWNYLHIKNQSNSISFTLPQKCSLYSRPGNIQVELVEFSYMGRKAPSEPGYSEFYTINMSEIDNSSATEWITSPNFGTSNDCFILGVANAHNTIGFPSGIAYPSYRVTSANCFGLKGQNPNINIRILDENGALAVLDAKYLLVLKFIIDTAH